MQSPRILVLAGVFFSLIAIGLGIAGLVTPVWIKTISPSNGNHTFSFLINQNTLPPLNSTLYTAAKGLAIGGVANIAVGVIVILILDIFIKYRWLQLGPSLMIYAGSVSILIGLILYVLFIVNYGASIGQKLDTLGYSFILMIVASLLGFLTALYFSFTTGHGIHTDRIITQKVLKIPTEIYQQTERF